MHEVTFRLPDERVTTTVGEQEYLLDAAEAEGLDLPYSCRNGMCTSCVADLESGEVDGSEGSGLSPDEEDDDYVLLCCSTPEADCEVRAGERVQNELLGLDVL